MDFLRKLVSTLFIIVVWVLLGVVGGFFIISLLLNPGKIKDLIAYNDGYTKILNVVESNFQNSTDPEAQQTLDFLKQNVTPDFVKQKLELAIDKYFAWLKGDQVDMKLPMSDLIANNEIIKQLQAQGIEIAPEDMSTLSDIQLPVPDAKSKAGWFSAYKIVTGQYFILLDIAVILSLIIILLRFALVDRLKWLFLIVVWPTFCFVFSTVFLYLFLNTILKSDTIISKIPELYRPLVVDKTGFTTKVILYGHYQIDILGLALTAITLTAWLVAKHFSTKVSTPSVAAAIPAAPPTPAAPAAPEPKKESVKK